MEFEIMKQSEVLLGKYFLFFLILVYIILKLTQKSEGIGSRIQSSSKILAL